MVDRRLTESVRRKYNRFARCYDLMQGPMESGMLARWQKQLWAEARGRVLEVGVGTGRNFAFYPPDVQVTGIDFSERMLEKARRRQRKQGTQVELLLMDAQEMSFPDASFDTVVSTCVFCTVPDPVAGLREVRRVLRPEGQLLMLEHVRSSRPVLGLGMDALNPVVRFLVGTEINRDTVTNVREAGLEVISVDRLWLDILLLIKAKRS